MPTRAPTHRPPGWTPPKPWNHAQTASQRGYGAPWRKVRAVLLLREPLCRPCRLAGRVTAATEVDHVVPKADGGDDRMTNLQPICRACHAAKSAREGASATARPKG